MNENVFMEGLKAYISGEDLAKIRSVKIGIAGAGGLGSNCSVNLVRSGFSRMKIVDFDKVEISNLNRQFYFTGQVGQSKVEALRENLCAINPELLIDAVDLRLDEGNIKAVFAECDIIIEALDSARTKKVLIETLLGEKDLIVAASGLAGYGNSDDIRVHRIKNGLYIIGDLDSDICDMPPLSPRVSVAAAKQADVVLSYVLGK